MFCSVGYICAADLEVVPEPQLHYEMLLNLRIL